MFNKARIKLTAWYLVIIMAVSLAFSLVIYEMLLVEVARFESAQRFRIERRIQNLEFSPGLAPPKITLPINSELIEETKKRILFSLGIVNGVILIISGTLGYWLAGKTLNPIREMVREQNRFISDASHELKTPLTSLQTAFDVYLREKKPSLKESQIVIKESAGEVKRLQTLTESLLSLTQYQQVQETKTFKKIESKEIIKKSILRLEPQAKIKKISIESNLVDASIQGDQYSLTNLFSILLDNAIKYSQTGKTVKVLSKVKNGHLLVSFVDNGIGISKEDLPHIFDRFYRANKARNDINTNGYGLGLSIAREIAKSHNATLTVTSSKAGSTFTVNFSI